MKALVEATPISVPARIGTASPDSRAMVDVVTFTTPTTCATCGAAWRSAASVSAVSPDWETTLAMPREESGGSR